MFIPRTDMADERREDILRRASRDIPGLDADIFEDGGIKVTRISVRSPEAAREMDKPEGEYITLDLDRKWQQDDELVTDSARRISKYLTPLIPESGGILAVGLGNRYITADALGPLTCEKIIVTRHLKSHMPDVFSSMREVSCISPGVLGQTGIEVQDIVAALCRAVSPSAVIAIDALAARSLSRLGCSFQISTGGIIPGEGAGSRRFALNRDTLGVPVISLGVPTVVDAATLARDMTGTDAGIESGGFLVSPGDVDLLIAKSAKAIGYAVDLTLHGDMAISDIEQLLP